VCVFISVDVDVATIVDIVVDTVVATVVVHIHFQQLFGKIRTKPKKFKAISDEQLKRKQKKEF
jgi:uncharacterized transporter YbjL